MIINWLGHLSVKLQDKIGQDGITVLINPVNAATEGAIVAWTNPQEKDKKVKGTPFLIDCAGEYDTSGVLIEGIDSYPEEAVANNLPADNLIYRVEIDDISVVHLGSLSRSLTDDQLGKLLGVDVLLVPIGGNKTIDASVAAAIVASIEPRLVIPIGYEDASQVEKFVKQLGVVPTQEEKLRLTKKDLPQEEMELVILQVN
ncbi:MAG: MBL fold metallo-hydrolase [Patescibacteria group bacterium]